MRRSRTKRKSAAGCSPEASASPSAWRTGTTSSPTWKTPWKWSDRKDRYGRLHDSQHPADDCWIFCCESVTNRSSPFYADDRTVPYRGMQARCAGRPGRRQALHPAFYAVAGSELRRETALGNTPHERQREIMRFITEHGERLARVATSGLHLTDDLKARVLSTFLTLMNLREN